MRNGANLLTVTTLRAKEESTHASTPRESNNPLACTYHGVEGRGRKAAVSLAVSGADLGLGHVEMAALPEIGGMAADLGGQVLGVAALLEEGAELALLGRQLALGRGAGQAGAGALAGQQGLRGHGTGGGARPGRCLGRRAAALVGEGTSSAFLPTSAVGTIATLLVAEEGVDWEGRGAWIGIGRRA